MLRKLFTRIVRGAAPALGLAVSVTPAPAQSVAGEAYGAFVSTPVASLARAPRAVLSGADMAEASADQVAVTGALSSTLLTAVTSGAAGLSKSGAQSIATVADVSILNGVVRAARVISIAASTKYGSTATSNTYGSTFERLVVNGVTVASDGAVVPNTRIDLPAIGYVVLNEQIRSGNGTTTSGITVNMIHVVLVDALTGARRGDIIVGSASSAVN
ncbi:MAG: hypothetical protein HY560_05530 [Gemmatimonadetes bacterium]|nr:hypothetical protein [Gemmatimonadota bacterium]